MARSQSTRSRHVAIAVLAAALLLAPAGAGAQAPEPTPLDRYFDAPLDFRPPPGTYQFLRQPSGKRHIYMHVPPEAGWNESTEDNSGRTGVASLYLWVDHEGGGDGGGIMGMARCLGAARGAALANQGCFILYGQADVIADGGYANPVEMLLSDNGHRNASAVGYVSRILRTGPRDAGSDAFMIGVGSQSEWAPIDAHVWAAGQARAGVDLTSHQSAEHVGMALRRGHGVFFDAQASTQRGVPRMEDPGTTWTRLYQYPDGTWVLITAVEGHPTLQVMPEWLAVSGGMVMTGDLYLLGLAEGPGPAIERDRPAGKALCLDDAGRVYVAPGGQC